ncbi:MAG: NADP-dependent glyceraldehyde-3-phosphate dehydrogenase [Defluviitaleaceae bacterium]|nr:NADP-dependent glyceraldehyde-3-phosphate dehydrogenase [Defluviitaleaceae bacterium]
MFNEISNDKVYKNLIHGEWVESENLENLIEIKSPLDGSLVGKVTAMSKKDIDNVIKSAKKAQANWDNVPIIKRVEILYKAADILEKHSNEIAEIMLYEVCKDIKSAKTEVLRTADLIRSTANHSDILQGESLTGSVYPGYTKNKQAIVTKVPLGVVLAISPFNYPINLAASKIAPAILAGNSVVFKSATQGVISALHMVKCFEEAGVPAGVLNSVTGYGSEIGDYIVSHRGINFINYTGSTEVGRKLSKLAEMTPLLMELGGKDSAIVLDDADLNLAANNIVSGAFSYSGQRCTAIKRILVTKDVADNLVSLIKDEMTKIKAGNPIHEDVTVVPLIDEKTAEFVESLIEDAKKLGADILIGGKRDKNLVYPTLVDNVTENMRLAWEEPFGPVLPIIRVKDIEEAIEISNKSEYGLQASVFTKDINKAFYVANKLEVGAVQINNKTERGPDIFPFSGVKDSGVGVQGVKYAIEAMTRPKSIVLNLNL